jgi:hypothetical protein
MHTPKPHTTDEIREDSILSNFLHSMQKRTESALTADSIDNHISYTPSEDGK